MVRSWKAWWTEAEPWYVAVGLANMGMGTSSVLIPLLLSRVLGRPTSELGWLAALVSLMGVIGSLTWGRLSDAAHRRKLFIVASYAVTGALHASLWTVGSYSSLLLANMLLNLFWVANASVTVLVVIENRPKAMWESKIGQLNQIGALGWVGGLGLGGALLAALTHLTGEAAAIRMLFLLIAALQLSAAITAALTVPRTVPRFTARRFRGVILAVGNFLTERGSFSPQHLYHRLAPVLVWRRLFGESGFHSGTKRFLVVTLLAFVGFGLFAIPLPLALSERFGVPPSIVFAYFLIQHVAIVLAYPLASRRIKRLGNRRIQMLASGGRLLLFSGAAALTATSVAAPSWLLAAAFFAYGLSWSYYQLSGVALISRLARRENRGLALGLYNAVAGLGWILAGVGSGILTGSFGYAASFAAGAALLLACVASLLLVPDPSADGATPNDHGSRYALRDGYSGGAARRRAENAPSDAPAAPPTNPAAP